jgi:RNA-binding protein Nova
MDSNTKKITLKFLLSNSLTGSLIGTQGKAIKELITITDAKINVSSASDFYPGTSERVILISGSKEAVSLAQTLVWEMIGLMAKHAAENDGDTRLVEWNPRTAFEALGTNDSMEVTGKFSIPAAAGGVLLGKGGETLRGFSTQTSTRVTMSGKDEALFTQERIVTLAGTVGGCISCTDLILNKLYEQSEIIPFVNRGTTYSSPLTSTLGLLGSSESRGARRLGRGDPRRDAAEAAALPVTDTTITLSVPDELVGNIFGRQGSTMREIIALSGAKVVVSPRGECTEGTTNRIVTITGTPTAAQTAHLFITQRLHTPVNPPPRKPTGSNGHRENNKK